MMHDSWLRWRCIWPGGISGLYCRASVFQGMNESGHTVWVMSHMSRDSRIVLPRISILRYARVMSHSMSHTTLYGSCHTVWVTSHMWLDLRVVLPRISILRYEWVMAYCVSHVTLYESCHTVWVMSHIWRDEWVVLPLINIWRQSL